MLAGDTGVEGLVPTLRVVPKTAGVARAAMEALLDSDKVRDTGFTLEISDLPRREGDRVKLTVVETRLDACQSRTAAGKVPKPIDESKKHAATPVHAGSKVMLTTWSRERAVPVLSPPPGQV